MGDPDRLLNVTSDADDLERELLTSVRHVGPPRGAKDAGWAAIAAQVTAAVSVGTVAAHGATSAEASAASSTAVKAGLGSTVASGSTGMIAGTLSKALVTKGLVALVLGASSLGAGAWYMQHRSAALGSKAPLENARGAALVASPAPAVEAPTPAVNSSETVLNPSEQAPNPSAAVNPSPTAEPAALPAPSKRADGTARSNGSLEAESALLTEARAELRSGDARAAMATLDKLRVQYPKSILSQEREVLAIEVLAALGDTDGASRRARAFSDAHPNSPHTAKLRRFIIE